jgi:hypothetical protein
VGKIAHQRRNEVTMGTSKSMPTPKGGKWTGVKSDINAFISGNSKITPQRIIGSTIAAAGGLPLRSSGGSARASGSGGGGGSYGGGGSSVSRAASGLAGFGSVLGSGGLGDALESLGMEDLRGRPAGEVISKIAEHLSKDVDGLEKDLLRGAIQQAIYNAAELVDDPTYDNLETSLQTYLSQEGVEGLVELFLAQYIFDRVWLLIEDYANKRTEGETDIVNLETAVEHACRSNVHDAVERYKAEGRFDNTDWFGSQGLGVAEALIAGLEQRLRQASRGGAG